MKHTNFTLLHRQLKRQAELELKAALKAHGSKYVWREDPDDEDGWDGWDDDELPLILVTGSNDCVDRVVVYSASIGDMGEIRVYGRSEDGGSFDIHYTNDIPLSELNFLLDAIPETDDVKDVTVKKDEFVVASVCREDLAHCGFDAEHVDDWLMERIASRMCDAYCGSGAFWEDLREIASMACVPKIEEQ